MFFFKFYKYISDQIEMKNKKEKNWLSTIKKNGLDIKSLVFSYFLYF